MSSVNEASIQNHLEAEKIEVSPKAENSSVKKPMRPSREARERKLAQLKAEKELILPESEVTSVEIPEGSLSETESVSSKTSKVEKVQPLLEVLKEQSDAEDEWSSGSERSRKVTVVNTIEHEKEVEASASSGCLLDDSEDDEENEPNEPIKEIGSPERPGSCIIEGLPEEEEGDDDQFFRDLSDYEREQKTKKPSKYEKKKIEVITAKAKQIQDRHAAAEAIYEKIEKHKKALGGKAISLSTREAMLKSSIKAKLLENTKEGEDEEDALKVIECLRIAIDGASEINNINERGHCNQFIQGIIDKTHDAFWEDLDIVSDKFKLMNSGAKQAEARFTTCVESLDEPIAAMMKTSINKVAKCFKELQKSIKELTVDHAASLGAHEIEEKAKKDGISDDQKILESLGYVNKSMSLKYIKEDGEVVEKAIVRRQIPFMDHQNDDKSQNWVIPSISFNATILNSDGKNKQDRNDHCVHYYLKPFTQLLRRMFGENVVITGEGDAAKTIDGRGSVLLWDGLERIRGALVIKVLCKKNIWTITPQSFIVTSVVNTTGTILMSNESSRRPIIQFPQEDTRLFMAEDQNISIINTGSMLRLISPGGGSEMAEIKHKEYIIPLELYDYCKKVYNPYENSALPRYYSIVDLIDSMEEKEAKSMRRVNSKPVVFKNATFTFNHKDFTVVLSSK